MRRILFQWRGITIHAYPALLCVGIVVGVIAGTLAAAGHGLDPARTYAAMLLLVAPAIVGSRLLYVACDWQLFRRQTHRIWLPAGGGAAMYGGLLLALLVSVPLLSALALPLGAFWDTATITMLVGMVFARIGCQLNGCCAGRPADGPLALCLPNHHGVWRRRLPSQLFEIGLAAVLLTASIAAWNSLPFDGAIFLGNLAAYGIGRCLLESTREASSDGPVNRVISLALASVALAVLLVMVVAGAGEEWRQAPVPAAESLSEWCFLLAPLAVVIVLLLFGFIGCSFDVSGLGGPPLSQSYPQAVANDNPVAWWQLQETNPPTSPNGGTATDQKGGKPGQYNSPATGYPANLATGSIGAPSPVTLNLGVAGLLATDPTNVAIEVQGGYMSVPQGAGLFQSQFTLELLAAIEFNLAQTGYTLPLMSCLDAAKNKGFALFAGPDPNNPSGYSWQLKVGTGSATVALPPMITRPGDPGLNVVALPTYFAMTYDGNSFSMFYYYGNRNLDWLTYALPFPGGSGGFAAPDASADLLVGITFPPVPPPIAQVQATGKASSGTTNASVSQPFGNPTTSGNLLVVVIGLKAAAGTNAITPTIVDNYNNTWKKACRAVNGTSSIDIWYAENCTGGMNHQISVTPGAAAFVVFSLAEYSGVAVQNALDQNTQNSANSAAPNSGSVVTNTAGELYIGGLRIGNAVPEAGWTTVFANVPSATTLAINVESFGAGTVAAAGNYAATWMLAAPTAWAACLATFRPVKPPPPNPFFGKIAQVAVYNQVLPGADIRTHGIAAFTS